MKKHALTLIKIVFSVSLITYLFVYQVDFKEVIRVFSGINPGWLAAGICLHFTGLLFSAIRWKILLAAQNINQPLYRLMLYYLVGHFFSMFLPTKVGGDVVRVYDTSKDHGSTAEPLAVILVERISGMLTMLVIAAIVLSLNINIGFDYKSHLPGINLALITFFAAVIVFPFLFHRKMESIIFKIIGKLPMAGKAEPILRKIYHAFQIYGGKPKHLTAALGVGTLLQLNYFLHYFFLAKALGIDLSLSFFFVIIPIRTVALMIPFFINGIGLREFFDVTAFSLVGVSQSSAVAFAELAWFVQIALALFGCIFYALRTRQPNQKTQKVP